jgi:hypothetical protein
MASERRVTAGLAAVRDAGATLVLAEIVGRSVGTDGAVAGNAAAVAFAGAVVAAALALDGERSASLAHAATRSAWLAVAAAVLVLVHVGERAGLAGAVRIGVATGVLALAASGAMRLGGDLLGGPARGRLAAYMRLAWAVTAPLWLGPAIERAGAPEPAVDALVAASPLTYLAVVAGYDYLREPWFYLRSPVASLRFAYPGAIALTAGWLAVGTLLLHADRVLPERWRRG